MSTTNDYDDITYDDDNLIDESCSIHKVVEDKMNFANLYSALEKLSDSERELIQEIYFNFKSERE